MPQKLASRITLVIFWAILTFTSLYLRPLFPIDETRYAAVAWEMWTRGDFLVPHLNGETYSHKPPLLFWLMQLSWRVFGVNDWSLRVIAPLFSLASIFLSSSLASVLWPERKQIAEITPFILLGSFFWMIYGTLTMFDIMLSFFVLLGVYAVAIMCRYGLSRKRTLLLGIAIGGGVLTKGPVILLHLLPLALIAPWRLRQSDEGNDRRSWYLAVLWSVLIGAAIALCWAIPAGMAGGVVYRNAIFLGQTSGRLVDSFAHKLPWWWYLTHLPIILLPWLFLKPLWKGMAGVDYSDFGCRFCLLWGLPVFIAFSLVSGKRIHYLLPLMPLAALLFAWALSRIQADWRRYQIGAASIYGIIGLALICLPWLNSRLSWSSELSSLSILWGLPLLISALSAPLIKTESVEKWVRFVCLTGIVAALMLAGGYFQIFGFRYDTAPTAQKIAGLLAENREVAFFGNKYHGQFHFSGRLTQSLALISSRKAVIEYANAHPSGFILVEYQDQLPDLLAAMTYRYPFKSHNLGFVACRSVIENPRIVEKMNPA